MYINPLIINITSNACKVDFYTAYAKDNPRKKYLINIAAGVTLSGCNTGDTALSFSSMPFSATIIINNNGTIVGAGGRGGAGARTIQDNPFCPIVLPGAGQVGGAAISTKAGVVVTVNNYGLIAGGGGGGAGGGPNPPPAGTGSGGGGGGGAGIAAGAGGDAGGIYLGGTCIYNDMETTSGQPGTTTIGGAGGNGGTSGNPGATGGNRAQPGSSTAFTSGGAAGKAISGGSGNIINNISGGQSFGTVD